MIKNLCSLLLIAAMALQAQPPRGKVVVISLDGFPAYALDDPKLPVPTLRRLMRNGVCVAGSDTRRDGWACAY